MTARPRTRISKTVRGCRWCGEASDYQAYHDSESSFPVDDDQRLFEKISLKVEIDEGTTRAEIAH